MRWRFSLYELDVARRELSVGGRLVPVQPLVLAVLEYLVAHRERVVTKAELLGQMWAGAMVTDASLQRAVSLARRALRPEDRHLIRTHARHGYRFVGEAEAARGAEADEGPDAPLRYAESGGVHIAYRVFGGGGADVALVFGWSFSMRAALGCPPARALIADLSRHARVVLFDKRGTGASDRVKVPATPDQRAADFEAVLDAAGSHRAILVGFSEGGPLAIRYAARNAARVRALVLVGAFARMAASADHPHGWTTREVDALRTYIRTRWGSGVTMRAMIPRRHRTPALDRWASEAEQEGASPGAALELLTMNLDIDVRALLPAVTAPSVVLHAADDPVIRVGNGRDLAARLARARLVEVRGDDHAFLFEGRQALLEELERFGDRAERRSTVT